MPPPVHRNQHRPCVGGQEAWGRGTLTNESPADPSNVPSRRLSLRAKVGQEGRANLCEELPQEQNQDPSPEREGRVGWPGNHRRDQGNPPLDLMASQGGWTHLWPWGRDATCS